MNVLKDFIRACIISEAQTKNENFEVDSPYQMDLKNKEGARIGSGFLVCVSCEEGFDADKELSEECKETLRKVPKNNFKIFMLMGSWVAEEYHNQGYGIQLYVEAVKKISEVNGVLIPHKCEGNSTATSPEALRVWSSSRFKSAVNVIDGLVAYI